MCFSLDCHRWRLEMHRGHTDRSVCAWKEGGFITECIIWECFLSEGQMPCEYEWYLIHAEGTHPGGGDHDSVSLQNEKKKVPMNEKKKQRQYRPLRIYHIFLLRWPFLWWPLQSWDAAISRESFEVRTVEEVRLHVSLFSHRWIRFAWNECFSALIHPFEYLTEDRRPLHWLYSPYMCNRLQNPAQTSSQNTFRSYSHLTWCFLHK